MPLEKSVISDGELQRRYASGQIAASIARDVGLTRERIRQKLEKLGLKGRNPNAAPTGRDVLEAAEIGHTFDDLAEELERSVSGLNTVLAQHGIREEVRGLLKANQKARSQRLLRAKRGPLINRLREIAIAVGHTPTIRELEAERIFHAELHRVFGSATTAMEAAGLRPNPPGGGPEELPPDLHEFDGATENEAELVERAGQLLQSGESLEAPRGNRTPAAREVPSKAYVRDPAVVAWILQEAAGQCEGCGVLGYGTDRTEHYLEVHHVVPLSEGGPDVISNAVAVCATCHGKLHRWIHRDRLLGQVRETVSRLE